MPRDIPVGNGRLLVTFDDRYQVRDVYFPHVGQENHGGGAPFRFGVHSDVPGEHRSHMYWTSDGSWHVRQRYLRDTLTTSVSMDNQDLRLAVYCNDVVDFNRNILVRKIKLKNLAGQLIEAKKQLDSSGARAYKFEVSGHTDSVGDAAKNKKLSEKRAEVIVKEMVARGVPRSEIIAVGRGSEQMLAKPDNTEAKRAQNRRYEIQVRL